MHSFASHACIKLLELSSYEAFELILAHVWCIRKFSECKELVFWVSLLVKCSSRSMQGPISLVYTHPRQPETHLQASQCGDLQVMSRVISHLAVTINIPLDKHMLFSCTSAEEAGAGGLTKTSCAFPPRREPLRTATDGPLFFLSSPLLSSLFSGSWATQEPTDSS